MSLCIPILQDLPSGYHKPLPETHKGRTHNIDIIPCAQHPAVGDDPEMRHDFSCGRCNMKVPWAQKT